MSLPMGARSAFPTLVLVAAATLLPPGTVAAGPWGLAKGETFTSIEGNLFSTSTEYDDRGVSADRGRVVEQRALMSHAELGWKKRVTVLLGVPVVSVTRRSRFFDSRSIEGTATGFQDALVGLRVGLKSGRTAVAVENTLRLPTGYNWKLDSLGTQLGDGFLEARSELQLGTALFGRGFVQASVGAAYRRRSSKDSTTYLGPAGRPVRVQQTTTEEAKRLLTSADLGLWVARSLLVGGRYRGEVTLSSSVSQTTPQAGIPSLVPVRPLAGESDTHLAGPFVSYRFDDRLEMFAGSWSTISGKNTLHFHQAYVGVAFRKTKLGRLQGFLGGPQSP